MMRRLVLLAVAFTTAAWADPSGDSWPKPYPKYRVFNHSAVNGISNFNTNVLPHIQAGFRNWTASGTPAVSCTDWNVTYDGPVRIRSTATAGQPDAGIYTEPADKYVPSLDGGTGVGLLRLFTLQDSINNVAFIGSKWSDGSQTLGVTIRATIVGQSEITDADMKLNNNVTWSNSGAFNTFDVESVVLHEAGHFIGLDHSNTVSSVMYPSVAPGEIKRTLAQIDIQDTCQVYPGTPGTQGYACTTSTVCTGGLVCRGPSAGGAKICTVDCTNGQTCPTGYACQAADTGMACLTMVGAVDLCKFCEEGMECLSGNCIHNDVYSWCTRSCTASSQCGTGYVCVQTQGGGGVCAQDNANFACTSQCGAGMACPPGYECNSGSCVPRGDPGDSCDSTGFCKPCNLCIRDGQTNLSTCRSCCTGGTGSYCSGCSATTCGSGTACTALLGTQEKVCYPTTGAALCQACNASTPCAQGTCYGGRCHNSCNPGSPGTCQACNATGTSMGVCACTDEMANVGQTCGTANGFPTCRSGLVCAGTAGAKTCRKLCTLSNNATCSAGEVCALTDGQPICVTGQQPGQKCNPCGSGCATGLTCHEGRCYEPCNIAVTTCNGCVEAAAGGAGVCACDDQRSPVNGPCTLSPVLACQAGLTCVDNFCRAACDPKVPNTCGPGLECRASGTTGLCQPPSSNCPDAGPSGADGGSNGTGGGGSFQEDSVGGCGCNSGTTSSLALWVLGMLGLSRVWRSHRGSSPE